jgi:hypothetical protein
MVILAKVQAHGARRLERMLIQEYSAKHGCCNIAPGGEGMSDTGRFAFVYVVTS